MAVANGGRKLGDSRRRLGIARTKRCERRDKPVTASRRKCLEPSAEERECSLMGNSQGRDNVKKRKARRKKTERLALAKKTSKKKAK